MIRLCIKAENKKLRHSVIWAACILIPIIPAIMGTFNYEQNLGILTGKWYSLWSQLSLFYSCFFYAPLIALYCSYLWRLEHLNHNWNVLMTAPVSIPGIFFSKLAVILKVTVITQVWLLRSFSSAESLSGFPDGFLPKSSSGSCGEPWQLWLSALCSYCYHVYPKLFRTYRNCSGRRCGRSYHQQQRPWTVLALRPDAHGYELQ